MKNLSYALALVALLGAGSAAAGEGNPGENQFHGSTTMLSYGADASASQVAAFGSAQRQIVDADQVRPQTASAQVWGDKAVDPVYRNQAAEPIVRVDVGDAPVAHAAADETDFIQAYAN